MRIGIARITVLSDHFFITAEESLHFCNHLGVQFTKGVKYTGDVRIPCYSSRSSRLTAIQLILYSPEHLVKT